MAYDNSGKSQVVRGAQALSEVARFTKLADQERKAKQAFADLQRSESEQARPTFDPRLDKSGKK